MAENIHNWDIQTLDQMKTEIDNIIGILTENENLLESQGFELLGLAGTGRKKNYACYCGKCRGDIGTYKGLHISS